MLNSTHAAQLNVNLSDCIPPKSKRICIVFHISPKKNTAVTATKTLLTFPQKKWQLNRWAGGDGDGSGSGGGGGGGGGSGR